MNVKFGLKIKETAKLCAKAIKDIVVQDPKEEDAIDKIIAEAENNGSNTRINKQSNPDNK
jgi:hypothetical protein